MVSVCSGCDLYHPLTAGMLGSMAGMLYLFTSAVMVKLREHHSSQKITVFSAKKRSKNTNDS